MKRHQTHRVGLVLFLLAASFPAHADRIDDYIQAQMQWQHIAGLSLAVVREGKVIKAKGYGLANVETDTPATPEAVFKIGSISKQFLAAVIMLLVQEGKISLDDRISPWLDGAPETWKDITLRHLLTHTSGLVRESPGFDPFKLQSDIEVIKAAYPLPLRFAPGEKWAYSNVGYYVLAEIIHRVSGKPWPLFCTERLFAPSSMSATRTTTVDMVRHRASGYMQAGGKRQNAENWLALRPSGAFLSTVRDLARWDTLLYSDAILSQSSREQIWTPVTLKQGTRYPYGFGWFLDTWQGHKRVHHDGGMPGFSADFERFVDDRLTVIVLTNATNCDLHDLAIQVAGFYEPALMPIVEPASTDTEPTVSAQIKAILGDLAKGRLEAYLFTSSLAAGLSEDLKSGFADDLRRLGTIRSIVLLERRGDGDNLIYRYRVVYRYMSLFVGCTFDKNKKIARLAISD